MMRLHLAITTALLLFPLPGVLGVQALASSQTSGLGPPADCTLAPFGQPENVGFDRNGEFLAVRFDPSFAPPYSVTQISFPSFTRNGVPAVFPSVRVCEASAAGGPLLATPRFAQAPYVGSADGMNIIPLELGVTQADRTFFVVIEFPARGPTYPNEQPMLRVDSADLERGYFAASYSVNQAGGATLLEAGNLVVAMTCRVDDPRRIPIEAPTNLGANRVGSRLEFTFKAPNDATVDGSFLPRHSLKRVEVLTRRDVGPWEVVSTLSPSSSDFHVDSLPFGSSVWAVRAIDRNGNRSPISNAERVNSFDLTFPSTWVPDEPNGAQGEATPVPRFIESETVYLYPSADVDYYTFTAFPGDEIRIWGEPVPGPPVVERPDLAAALYDGVGRLIAFDDNSLHGVSPRIDFLVPERSRGVNQRLTVGFFDVRGTEFSPGTHRRPLGLPGYRYHIEAVSRVSFGIRAASATGGTNDPGIRIGQLAYLGGSSAELSVTHSGPSQALPGRLMIFDVRGRLLRTFEWSGGTPLHTVAWDGRDRAGTRVPNGVYFANSISGEERFTRKFTLLR
jgi:hypothetical protein